MKKSILRQRIEVMGKVCLSAGLESRHALQLIHREKVDAPEAEILVCSNGTVLFALTADKSDVDFELRSMLSLGWRVTPEWIIPPKVDVDPTNQQYPEWRNVIPNQYCEGYLYDVFYRTFDAKSIELANAFAMCCASGFRPNMISDHYNHGCGYVFSDLLAYIMPLNIHSKDLVTELVNPLTIAKWVNK